MSEGRPAQLPEPGYTAPQRLFLEDGDCVVRFYPKPMGPHRDFKVSALPVSRELQVGLARAFDAHVGPSSEVNAAASAGNVFRLLRYFCDVVARMDPPPRTPGELRPTLMTEYELLRKDKVGLSYEVGVLKTVLKQMDGLSPEFVNALTRPSTVRRDYGTQAGSYTVDEERRILKAARGTLRETARRIRDNRELLELWRNKDPQIIADAR